MSAVYVINRLDIERAEMEAHAAVSAAFAKLTALLPLENADLVHPQTYNSPTDEHCRDRRIKSGKNLTADGVEILFRLLDEGAGYNSAGRRLSITQTAVKNRKKEWEAAGGTKRKKMFVPWVDV